MQKIVSVLIGLAILAVAAPAVSAETTTESYTGSAGFFVAGAGLSLMCGEGCMGVEGFPNFGGAYLEVGGVYTNVIASASDDVYGSSPAISACFWNPDGDNICDGDDYGSDWVCGTVPLLGSIFPSNAATVWAISILASEDLDVCGATAGSITGDFF